MLKAAISLFFLSFCSSAQVHLSGGGFFLPPREPPRPIVPRPIPWPEGTMTLMRHGYRMDAAFYDDPNQFITEEQANDLLLLSNQREYLDRLWRDHALRNDFEPWNPPLITEQPFLQRSIFGMLQNMRERNLVFNQIIVTPMRRGIQTLEILVAIARRSGFEMPRRIIVDQRLREWPHSMPEAPLERINFELRIPSIEIVEIEAESPEIFEAELAHDARRTHQRRLLRVLAGYATGGHTLIIGHLPLFYATDPEVMRPLQVAEMGAHMVIQAQNQNLGNLLSEHGVQR